MAWNPFKALTKRAQKASKKQQTHKEKASPSRSKPKSSGKKSGGKKNNTKPTGTANHRGGTTAASNRRRNQDTYQNRKNRQQQAQKRQETRQQNRAERAKTGGTGQHRGGTTYKRYDTKSKYTTANQRREGANRAKETGAVKTASTVASLTAGTGKYIAERAAGAVSKTYTSASENAYRKAGSGRKGTTPHAPTKNDRLNDTQKRQRQDYYDARQKQKQREKDIASHGDSFTYTDSKGKKHTQSYAKGGHDVNAKITKAKEKTLEEATKGLSDKEHTLDLSNVPIYGKKVKADKERQKAEARAEAAESKLEAVQNAAKDFDKVAKDNGWDDDTVLDNGMTVAQFRSQYLKDANAEMDKALNKSLKSVNKSIEESGKLKFSNKDLGKGGIKLAAEFADYLIPYGATAKGSIKAVEAARAASKAAKAGRILTETAEDGAKIISKAAKNKGIIRKELQELIKQGKSKEEALKIVQKKLQKDVKKQGFKNELIANAVQDATLGTAIDLYKGGQEGLQGKDLGKYMAQNAALNAGMGVVASRIAGRTSKAAKASLNREAEAALNETIGIKSLSASERKRAFELAAKADLRTMTKEDYAELKTLNNKAKAIAIHNDEIRADLNKSVKVKAETLNKLSKETGVEYKVATTKEISDALKNNEKYAASVEDDFFANGVVVTGKGGKKTIYINSDSTQALGTIAGHETTHLLSGTKQFDSLKSAVKEYAESLGEYSDLEVRYADLYKQEMKGMSEEEAQKFLDEEITSELVGRYLFSGNADEFVKSLSLKDRNVFQKIYDYVVDALKKSTGTAEAKQLNAVKESFEKAYKEMGAGAEGTKLSKGYHAGDLGKSEPRSSMSADRSTGHFGTGTYFVGNKTRIEGYNQRGGKAAPVEEVDFDKYNLWKPLIKSDAMDLHDFLKAVNTYWDKADSRFQTMDDVFDTMRDGRKIYDEYYNAASKERADWTEPPTQATLNKYGDKYRQFFEETGALRIYDDIIKDHIGRSKEFDGNYTDYMIDDFASQFEGTDTKWYNQADDIRSNIGDEYSLLTRAEHLFRGIPAKKIKRSLLEVAEEMRADKTPMNVQDSASTRLMKKLGYEGVDVRGTDLDNTMYGSVIYDLKGEDLARKNEIGTARFSKSKKTDKADNVDNAKPIDSKPQGEYTRGEKGGNANEDRRTLTEGEENLSETPEEVRGVPGTEERTGENQGGGGEKQHSPVTFGGVGEHVLSGPELRKHLSDNGVKVGNIVDRSSDPEAFIKKLQHNAKSQPFGVAVDSDLKAKDLKGAKLFSSSAGNVTIGVKPDGDIFALAKHSSSQDPKGLVDAIYAAIANGGNKMDAYGRTLANKYAQFGFEPVARVEFNPEYISEEAMPAFQKMIGRGNPPDVYVFKHNGDSIEEIARKRESGEYKLWSQEELDNLKTLEYDDAMSYRDQLIKDAESRQEAPKGEEGPTTQPKPETPAEPKTEHPAATPRGNATKDELEAFRETDTYKGFMKTKSDYASEPLKRRVDNALKYGLDVRKDVEEFYGLGREIAAARAKAKNSHTQEHIEQYEREANEAYAQQTRIAENIYRDYARHIEKTFGKPHAASDITAVESDGIHTALESVGGADGVAKEIKKASNVRFGDGSKKAQKVVAEEMNDYSTCLRNYLDGDATKDADMQMARSTALLDNISAKLKANPDDAQAMSDLLKVIDKLGEDGKLPSNVRRSAKMIATATPKGRVGVALKAVNDLNARYGDRVDGVLKLTDDEITRLTVTEPGEELDEIYDEIAARLWADIPATRIEKFNEIRHMFMLANVRTHMRNFFGNLTFRGIRRAGDNLEALLQDKVFRKAIESRGGEVDKVKVAKREIRENNDFLEKEFHEIYDSSGSVSRYVETNRPDGVPIVKQKQLNWFIQTNYKWLEKEDMFTFIPAFKKSYMQYVKAKNWDIKNLTPEQRKMAQDRALFDAEYATFRDASAFSTWLTGKKHWLATKEGKSKLGTGMYRFMNASLEGVIPFVKTPVNIFRRSIDYSPASVVRAFGELMSKDPETFKQGIKHLSTGLTGTGIFGLGFFANHIGAIEIDTQSGEHSGSKYYDSDMGYQDYSLVITAGGTKMSWSIDWVQPIEASLFMGAAFRDMINDFEDGDVNIGTDAIAALFSVTSPVMDASFMSSAKDMLETFERRAAKTDSEGELSTRQALAQMLLGDLPKNYISSAVPQVFSQAANITDKYQRDTSSTLKDPIAASWDSAAKQLVNRIPGFRLLLNRKLDRRGEDKTNTGDNIATKIFFCAINPSNTKFITEDKYDRELYKIHESIKDKSSDDYKYFFYNFTGSPSYDLANGKRMTYREAYDYAKANRVEQNNIVKKMIDAPSYNVMTDEMKVDEVDSAHWIGNMVADRDTYNVNYALKVMKNGTTQRDKHDTEIYKRYKEEGGKDKEAFWDWRVDKERLLARSHASGDDTYRVKGLIAIEQGNDALLAASDLEGNKENELRHYWEIKSKRHGAKAKGVCFDKLSDACCRIVSNLKSEKCSGTSLSIKSVAAGKVAVDHKKIDEEEYRALGHFWNSAQAGGGLMLKYNKNHKYDLPKIEQYSYDLKRRIEKRGESESSKDVVMDYIENELKVKNNDERACLYQILYLGGHNSPYIKARWKNPYKEKIDDHLEWGEDKDDEWGEAKKSKGRGGWGRRGRRGWGGGGWGSGGGGGGVAAEESAVAVSPVTGARYKTPAYTAATAKTSAPQNTRINGTKAKATDWTKQSTLTEAYRKRVRKQMQKNRLV